MSASLLSQRNRRYKPALAWLAWFTVVWTLLLLLMGGFTTSIGAGMVFLDWPLSDGSLNPHGWLSDRDRFAEHSHRLLGAQVGLLVLALAVLLYFKEERPWLRHLGLAGFLLVTVQGLLGGARVRFDQLNIESSHNLLAQTFAIIHAFSAQVFLCVTVAMALGLSRAWTENADRLPRPVDHAVRTWGVAACSAVLLQLVLGAVMRHHHAGLAIPYFPLSAPGSLLPPAWGFQVGIHFAHRLGAILVTAVLLGFAWKLWRGAEPAAVVRVLALSLAGLLALQIYLGASIIWSHRNPYPTTLHVIVGALTLALTWGLTFTCFRSPETPAGSRNSASRTKPAHRSAAGAAGFQT